MNRMLLPLALAITVGSLAAGCTLYKSETIETTETTAPTASAISSTERIKALETKIESLEKKLERLEDQLRR